MEFFKKLSFLRRREHFDAALSEEMQFHLEERADELERTGLSREEALRRARAEFGSVSRLAEDSRGQWQWQPWEDLWADVRYAVRSLQRDPGFLTVAVLSLGLGIGVNTAIFSLTMEALMSQPSARDASTLASVRMGGNSHIGLPQLQFLRDAKVMPGVAGLREDGDINWRQGDETQRLFAMRVTDNLFDMAGIPLLRGRGIGPGDQDMVVLTHRAWQAKLAADPDVLGRKLLLDGRPHTVVGLLPEDHRTLFGLGIAPDLYAPVRQAGAAVQLYARLPAGTGPAAIHERLRRVGRQLDEAMPERHFKYENDIRVTGVAGLARLTGTKSIGLFFAMLMAVVSLLLGIACLNVSGLLVARASSREQELAIRASLGAGRGRLLRQLLTESLVLALTGTAAGLILNVILTRGMSNIDLGLPVPVLVRIEPDGRLLAYASLIATACALMVGLLPAWRASRSVAGDALKSTARQVGSRMNLRRGLVVAQVAASIVVLTTAVLFARNLFSSLSADPGFDLRKTLYVSMRLVPDAYPDFSSRAALVARAQAALEQVPGVESAAATRMIPFNDDSSSQGPVETDLSASPFVIRRHSNDVGPGYFRTLGVPLLAGREFARTTEAGLIVNESFARAAFGNVSPVGHTVRLRDGEQTVIGVVRDSKYAWMSDHQRPAVFSAYDREAGGSRAAQLLFMVRASIDPEALVRPLRRQMLALDASAAVEVKPMRRAMGMALLPSRVGAGLLGVMGLLGLALTGIGLYGVMAYSVTRRVREIGLRMALGAPASRIRALVWGEGAMLMGVGLAIGLAASYFVTRPLAQFFVHGLSTADPATYASVVTLILLAGWMACALPVRRALRIQPLEALRHE